MYSTDAVVRTTLPGSSASTCVEVTGRNLGHPSRAGSEGEPSGVGVHRTGVHVPAVLVRLGAVKARCLQAHRLVRHSGGDHVVEDMGRILPVMSERRLRNFHRRGAMGIGHWSQRRVAHRCVVQVPKRVLAEPVRVLHAQLHHEVVRVLAVDDGLAVGGLAGLKQQGIALVADGRGLQAQHGAQHHVAAAQPMHGAEHAPVGGVKLVGAERSSLLRVHHEGLRHPHQAPLADAGHQHGHGPRRRLKSGAGRLAHEEVARRIHAVAHVLHGVRRHLHVHAGLLVRLWGGRRLRARSDRQQANEQQA